MAEKKHLYITPEILSDLPVESDPSDFHFEDFAKTLARLIASRQTRTPLTIGVSGTWGSGKTTLLKRLQVQLDQTACLLPTQKTQPELLEFANEKEEPRKVFRACRTVWFNAWKYADEKELLVALVRVIVQRMWEDDFITQSLTALFEPFTPRRDVIDTVLGWFSIKTPYGEVKPGTGKPIETEFSQKTALLDRFNEVLDRLLGAWVHHSLDPKVTRINPDRGVLVILIDDLDRCLPAKAVQVLEAIKLFLDRPGCVFVIGADTALTAEAVQSYYDNASVTGQKAGDYLEKIIQLRFDLPPLVPTAMQSYLEKQKVESEMLAQWETLIAAAEVNPRRVKAVLNDIALRWSMVKNSGQAGEIRRSDFIRWNALWRAAPPEFRRKILEIGDLQLRWEYVRDALLWAQGLAGETVRSQFQEIDPRDSHRFRDVLCKIQTLDYDKRVLDALIFQIGLPERKVDHGLSGVVENDLQVVRSENLQGVPVGPGGADTAARTYKIWGGIEFAEIPAGRFLIGGRLEDRQAFEDEKDQHTIDLPTYWIGHYPLTNAQFQCFVDADNYQTEAEKAGSSQVWDNEKNKVVYVEGSCWRSPNGADSSILEKQDHPVVHITWNDAMAFCRWLNSAFGEELPLGMKFALPSEAEWEKAARGIYGNTFPWGNEFDLGFCNSGLSLIGDTTPVGKYSPSGDSPFGAADMAGNVWEWTRSIFKAYPYNPHDGREILEIIDKPRVLRGGSFDAGFRYLRCTYRQWVSPEVELGIIGFRVVVSPFY